MDWGLITQNLIQILINKVNLFNQAHQKRTKTKSLFSKNRPFQYVQKFTRNNFLKIYFCFVREGSQTFVFCLNSQKLIFLGQA